jgi:hypothetical protein
MNMNYQHPYKIGGVIVIEGKTLTIVGEDDGDLIGMTTTKTGAIREYRISSRGLRRIN